MFKKLPYNSKIEICKLYYNYNMGGPGLYRRHDHIEPVKVVCFFSWNKVIFEYTNNIIEVKRDTIEKWYKNNTKLIRKYKLLSITKRDMVV